mgnify:CR=1 FL=1
MVSAGRALIIVENNSVPFDRRVWREALALRDAGWSVSVICPENPEADKLIRPDSSGGLFEVLDGIHIYRFTLLFTSKGFSGYCREYLSAFAQITRLSWHVYRTGRFDVFQLCNPPDIFFPLSLFCQLCGTGVIFDHHDLFPESIAYRFRGFWGKLLYAVSRLMEYLTFRSSDVVMATNESYREIALSRGGKKPEDVFVVRNGPELDSFQPVAPDPSLKENFSYLVSYLGIMGVEDGVEPMLEAIRFVTHNLGRNDIYFALIGDGPMRELGQKRLTEWKLEKQVVMPGRLSERDVKKYLSTSDVCLSPDPYTPLNELSTMNKMMEYMIMGCPVVSFDLKEARVSAQEAAVYVPCGDARAFGRAIVDLLDDRARRKWMGELGRRRVLQDLAWGHQKQSLLAAYARAMKLSRVGV